MSRSSNPTIREFVESDLDMVRDLIYETIDVCYSDVYSKEAVQFFKDWHCDKNVLKDANDGHTIVLEKDSRMLGTGTIVGDEIKRVFVEPAFQKNGFGKILMQKLEEKALLTGVAVVKLDASLPSKKFYDSLAYITLETTFLEVENDKKLDYYMMEKSLINSNKLVAIKKANRTDISILLEILRKSFADVAERFNLTVENCPKNLAFCTEQWIKDDFARDLQYYILEENGQSCGCVALEKANYAVCYLERLAVLPEYRKKGFGKALVNHIFDIAIEMGMQRIEIGIISEDTELKDWYRKFGFVQKNTKKFNHLPFIVAFMFVEL